MNRWVPELVLDFSFEDFGFLRAPAKHTSKETRGIGVDTLHLLDSLIPSDFFQARIFWPSTDWKLIDNSNVSACACLHSTLRMMARKNSTNLSDVLLHIDKAGLDQFLFPRNRRLQRFAKVIKPLSYVLLP